MTEVIEEATSEFRGPFEDSFTTFQSVKTWKEKTGGLALAYFPVYFPEELAHAMDFLPVGVLGASGGVSLDIATAHTQSFVCSISRSTFQMTLQGNLDVFDALIFSNICDIARNLSGITKRNLPKRYIDYIHFPVNNSSAYATEYLRDEYHRIVRGLEAVSGNKLDQDKLKASISLYNEKRRLQRELVELRRSKPWLIPYSDWYSLIRAGSIMPAEAYVKEIRAALPKLSARKMRPMDRIRVAVIGNFCEQPPVTLMKVIEEAGSYIANDEALIGARWLADVPTEEDPVHSLAGAYVTNSEPLTVRFHPDIDKQQYITNFLSEIRAEGVIFCTPKFCEPALYDYMIYKGALDEMKMPYLHLEYEESSSSFEQIRMMVETFTESVLFD